MILEIEDVRVQRGGCPILKGCTLAVASGEVVVVLGPNGAGKSTLLRVATGELAPDDGEVRLCGRALGDFTIGQRARRRAVLTQSVELAFDFSVLELVLIGRTPHHAGRERAEDLQVAREALSLVGISGLAHRRMSTLSGGEQQLVHLARVLAQIWEAPSGGERLLLLDEPTSSLDLLHQQRVLEVARHFAARGAAVLTVLHDLNLAAQMADRVVVLDCGTVAACDRPKRALTSELVERVYGVQCLVLSHPERDVPLIVPLERAAAGRALPELALA